MSVIMYNPFYSWPQLTLAWTQPGPSDLS
uniref:Uncharacterized protein n=1 Tax=Anguilla anguilla TaxID=7936 RepID=A0A0E9VDB0_ANGAN